MNGLGLSCGVEKRIERFVIGKCLFQIITEALRNICGFFGHNLKRGGGIYV